MENLSPGKNPWLIIIGGANGSSHSFLAESLLQAQQILADTLLITFEECRAFASAVEKAFPTASLDELRQLAKPTKEQVVLDRQETPKHPPHYRRRNRDKRPVLGKADYTIKRR
ncbi:hypothetical protein DYU11_21100 [Fibrisoma montanum]|uniref:Uncharacterized protein n=1 Tax=Fibrisoma montanum TaxID=2305895 RepID=A0A418M405_9BACT|nr:hypothetical protein DYU11_21100 [Fibrisoma montanum]